MNLELWCLVGLLGLLFPFAGHLVLSRRRKLKALNEHFENVRRKYQRP